jgi:hypothetical protein
MIIFSPTEFGHCRAYATHDAGTRDAVEGLVAVVEMIGFTAQIVELLR